MISKEILRHFINIQSPLIKHRLLGFKDLIGISDTKITGFLILFGKIQVEQHTLFTTVRRAFESNTKEKLKDTDGQDLYVNIENESVHLTVKANNDSISMKELLVLSPHKEQRISAIRDIINWIGPMSPDYSFLIDRAQASSLSDENVRILLNEISNGVKGVQEKILNTINNENDLRVENIIPDSARYYEYFCGPDPKGISREEYINSNLANYRKEILKRDFSRGLEVCLLGSLHPNLSPRLWIEDKQEGLFDGTILDKKDVFSLLGMLDLALDRYSKEFYKDVSVKIIKLLVQEELKNATGINQYELLQIFANLILNRINCIEGVSIRPPYWKRMCALMHSAFLVNSLYQFEVNVEELKSWAEANKNLAGHFANILDLRREPLFSSFDISNFSIRREVISRLEKIETVNPTV